MTSSHDYERQIADDIASATRKMGGSPKDRMIFLLSSRFAETPSEGKVIKFDQPRWWIEERTFLVNHADAVIAIGGGKGTVDCVQKAFLAHKPVFVACAIPGASTQAWKNRPNGYSYLTEGDADFLEDINIKPQEFFDRVFSILDSLSEKRYPRRIFIVHGRNHQVRDALVSILQSLDFEPVVLEQEPSRSLTVIEKLERDTTNVGFGFVIYTPDELGNLPGEPAEPRTRQNVVFEHGLLFGLLSRERTCALVQHGVAIPSDLAGVIQLRFSELKDERREIERVLRDAGYRMSESPSR